MKKAWCVLFILILLSGFTVKNTNEPMPDSNIASSCNEIPAMSSIFGEQKGSIAQESGLFVAFFSKEYEGVYITKIRWQLVDNGSGNSTYIIEGIKEGNKYILKLLNVGSAAQKMEDITILGRVERPLAENELQDGKPIEKPLDLTKYIGVQQILDTALKEYNSIVQEWKVVWVDGRAVIQVILWDENFTAKILVMDAKSGEVLRKIP